MVQAAGRCADVGTASEKKNAVRPCESTRTDCMPELWPGSGDTRRPGRISASPSTTSSRPATAYGSQSAGR